MLKTLIQPFLQRTHPVVSHEERWVSGVGAWVGILAVYSVSSWALDGLVQIMIIASMGASAVLLFAVPHGALSQPWNLVGGHLVSAVIGVAAARWIPDMTLAAASAVGVSVFVMHYTHCIHPPGGATALFAVIGGEPVHSLGYGYVVYPVMVNVGVILLAAILFNALFHWRRYPMRPARPVAETLPAAGSDDIRREDLVFALSEIDSLIDISESDLLTIYELATHHRNERLSANLALKLGSFYSNDQFGESWSVRQIIDWDSGNDNDDRSVIFKVIAGPGRRQSHHTSDRLFRQWASHEVCLDGDHWRKVEPGDKNAQ